MVTSTLTLKKRRNGVYMNEDKKYKNQAGLLNVTDYDYLTIAIVGCGSIGSFLGLALSKLGFKKFVLIDPDKIEAHNVCTQVYHSNRVGDYKVRHLKAVISGNHEEGANIATHTEKLKKGSIIDADIVFSCVDSMDSRRSIARAVIDSVEKNGKPRLLIDGRMHRLVYRVFTVLTEDKESMKSYITSLQGKGHSGACTEKGIIQNVFGVVSVMIEQLRKVLEGHAFPGIVDCDLERYKQSPRNIKTDWKSSGVNA